MDGGDAWPTPFAGAPTQSPMDAPTAPAAPFRPPRSTLRQGEAKGLCDCCGVWRKETGETPEVVVVLPFALEAPNEDRRPRTGELRTLTSGERLTATGEPTLALSLGGGEAARPPAERASTKLPTQPTGKAPPVIGMVERVRGRGGEPILAERPCCKGERAPWFFTACGGTCAAGRGGGEAWPCTTTGTAGVMQLGATADDGPVCAANHGGCRSTKSSRPWKRGAGLFIPES